YSRVDAVSNNTAFPNQRNSHGWLPCRVAERQTETRFHPCSLKTPQNQSVCGSVCSVGSFSDLRVAGARLALQACQHVWRVNQFIHSDTTHFVAKTYPSYGRIPSSRKKRTNVNIPLLSCSRTRNPSR
ncbi:hypothetical protein CH063_07119, partial [Colletotrichum higginsianum]